MNHEADRAQDGPDTNGLQTCSGLFSLIPLLLVVDPVLVGL